MERRTLTELIVEAGKQPPRRRYAGAVKRDDTSTNFPNPTPGLANLVKKGALAGATKILDYGAGKWGRNANWLRNMGYQVYAYDPEHGVAGGDGWTEVAKEKPASTEKFDLGFTSYVLNVVPEHVEAEIIRDLSQYAREAYHIVRNKEVFDAAKKSLMAQDKWVTPFFMNVYATPALKRKYTTGKLTDEDIWEFARHGFETKKGFQRAPTSQDLGLNLVAGSDRATTNVYKA